MDNDQLQPPSTVVGLKSALKAIGQKTGGRKAELLERWRQCKSRQISVGDDQPLVADPHDAGQARGSATPIDATAGPMTGNVSMPKVATGVGARPAPKSASKISARLEKGTALAAIILKASDFSQLHRVTHECLDVLQVKIPETDSATYSSDAHVATALWPVLKFCQYLAAYTQDSQQSPDATANVRLLNRYLKVKIADIVAHAHYLADPVVQIFRTYDADLVRPVPAEQLSGYLSGQETGASETNVHGHNDQFAEDPDLQRALALSLSETNREPSALEVEECFGLPGFDVASVVKTGTIDTQHGEQAGRGDIPQLNVLLSSIPEDGITFKDLARCWKIHNHDYDLLDELAGELRRHVVHRNGRLYLPLVSSRDERLWPSDEDIRQIIIEAEGAVSFSDLMDATGTRDRGESQVEKWCHDLIQKGVMDFDHTRRFVLKDNEESDEPMPQREGRSARRGNDMEQPVAPDETSRGLPSTDLSGAFDTERTHAGVEVSTESATHLSSVSNEMKHIRAVILAHCRNWIESFPEPELADYNKDLTEAERTVIVAYIKVHISTKNREHDPRSAAATVKELLAAEDFPVAKAQHETALNAAVMLYYSRSSYRKKEKEVAQLASRAGHEAQAVSGDELDVAAAVDSTAPGEAPTFEQRSQSREIGSSRGEDLHSTDSIRKEARVRKRARSDDSENDGDPGDDDYEPG